MIIPMKKVRLVALKEDKDNLLKSLQRYGEFMIIPHSDNHEYIDTALEDAFIQRTEKSLKFLKQYQENSSGASVVNYEEFFKKDVNRQTLLESIEKNEELLVKLTEDNKIINDSINFLLPFSELNIILSELTATKYSVIHTGYIETSNLENLKIIMNDYGCELCDLSLLKKTNDGQAIVFAVYYEDNDTVMNKL